MPCINLPNNSGGVKPEVLKRVFSLKSLIHQNLISDKGGGEESCFLIFSGKWGGVNQFLTLAEKREKGGLEPSISG